MRSPRQPLSIAAYQAFVLMGADGNREHQAMGLAGEVGELVNKAKKLRFGYRASSVKFADLWDEAGDVLWYLASTAAAWGYELQDLAGAKTFAAFAAVELGRLEGSPHRQEPLHIHALWIDVQAGSISRIALGADEGPSVDVYLRYALSRLARFAEACNTTLDALALQNIAKLVERHPERRAAVDRVLQEVA